ncbi:hypothetical protein [Streptomyces sp. NPDC047525]|uniref:hypothetical protein n=1 Tax=Streptomyces sp. NPDC047525 TaxID=3155264 RepID=UPI0033DB997E
MTKYAKGDEVWEPTRRSFATVLGVFGATLTLENEAGAKWEARAERCMPATRAVDQAAPSGTAPIKALPSGVLLRDYVWVAGAYREVIDMRGRSDIDGKILVLREYGLWVMDRPGTVYRPTDHAATQ